jgi:hypothetical protein
MMVLLFAHVAPPSTMHNIRVKKGCVIYEKSVCNLAGYPCCFNDVEVDSRRSEGVPQIVFKTSSNVQR